MKLEELDQGSKSLLVIMDGFPFESDLYKVLGSWTIGTERILILFEALGAIFFIKNNKLTFNMYINIFKQKN